MSRVDYLNARVRGLKGRLLSTQRLLELARLDGVAAFAGALLAGSPYAALLEAAGGLTAGAAALERALVERLSNVLARLRRIADERTAPWLRLAVAPWDVANVKRILRGIRSGASLDETARAFAPVGALSIAELRTLAGAGSADEILQILVADLQDSIQNEPGFWVLIFELFTAGRRNPEIQREVGQLFARVRDHMAEIFKAKEREGVLKLRYPADAVVGYLIALADGIALQTLSDPERDHAGVIEAGTESARHLLTSE